MSRGKQAGSPVWFRCWACRRRGRDGGYRVTLTGRTRPYKPSRGSALGTRSTTTAREYICGCGHAGWSAHVDLCTYEQSR